MEERQYYEHLVGTVFDGRYTIEKLLGLGGMSAVYKARDAETGATVALKILKDDKAADTDAVNHFINEAKAVSLLSHPNIIGIYRVSDSTDAKYLVMEYAEGITLKTYMSKRGPLPFDEVIKFSEQILAALDHAHSRGIIHRDIKPQNIMVLEHGRIKLTDFGIAKFPGGEETSNIDKAMGTVYYISPEQAEGSPCDARSDLYSLGIMMYEMATGKLPFNSEHAAAVLMMHMQDKPENPRRYNKKIPRGLEQLILSAIEKKPQKRYQSAVDMFRELRRIEKHRHARVLTPAQVAAKKRSEKNREQNRPSRSLTPVIWGIACAVFIVAVVSLFTALDRLEIGSLGSVSITVPDVSGKTWLSEDELTEEAYNAQLETLGLADDYKISVEYTYSNTVEAGFIIKQNPGAGSARKSPCSITLTVSLGAEILTLGDYTIKDNRTAQAALRSDGFAVTVKYVDNPVIAAGYVVSTSPAPGTKLRRGSSVTVYVSQGTLIGKMNIADYCENAESEAAVLKKLTADGLLVGNVTYTRSNAAPGTVLFQSPEPGEIVYAGSSYVDFVVSGGPDFNINYYPDLTGKQLSEAQEALQKLGFSVVSIAESNAEEEGTILRQTPAVSDITAATKKVYLYYSTGNDAPAEYTVKFSITGQRLASAQVIIENAIEGVAGLDLTVVYKRSDIASGTVIAQSPKKGETVKLSEGKLAVTLTVSGGPDYRITVTVPDIMGLDEADAVAQLKDAGINATVVKSASTEPTGAVIAQEYESGTTITGFEGEISITVTVSGGEDYTDPAETTGTAETSADPGTGTETPGTDTQSPEVTQAPGTEPVTTSPEETTVPAV